MGAGRLVLVATPIGNLGDLSPRAVAALAAADVIACEDTRRTRKLLTHAGVPARRLIAVHDHNEATRSRELLARLVAGDTVAVVSDAGTPGISDPGERLVAAAAAAGIVVEVVPGPSAAIAALVASGLPAGRFCFEGFLPRRGSARTERLRAVAAEGRTTILFEAPHRLLATLGDLAGACGAQRAVTVCRELTKVHEEVWRGSLEGALAHFSRAEPRGEIVVVLAGAPPAPGPEDDEIEAALRERLEAGDTTRDAVASVAERLGVSRRTVYEVATRDRG